MSIKCELLDYAKSGNGKTVIIETDEIKTVSISYDGGRFHVSVNDKIVKLPTSVSQDWNVYVSKE